MGLRVLYPVHPAALMGGAEHLGGCRPQARTAGSDGSGSSKDRRLHARAVRIINIGQIQMLILIIVARKSNVIGVLIG